MSLTQVKDENILVLEFKLHIEVFKKDRFHCVQTEGDKNHLDHDTVLMQTGLSEHFYLSVI